MWLSVTEDPLRHWVEDASELIHTGTRKLRYLFISSCLSLLMVTPEMLTSWNFRSDYMCSAAQLTLWPENDFRQRDTEDCLHLWAHLQVTSMVVQGDASG